MTMEIHYSGGAGNTVGNGSLGGIMSTTVITSDQLQNLFDNITRNEALLGRTEYRCFYILNPTADATDRPDVTITFNAIPGVTNVAVGVDPAGPGDGSTYGVATTITTEDTTPSGVRFFDRSDEWDRIVLPIGYLRPGDAAAVWLRRQTEQGPQQVVGIDMKIEWDPHSITFPGQEVDDNCVIGELRKVVLSTPPFKIGSARIGFAEIS